MNMLNMDSVYTLQFSEKSKPCIPYNTIMYICTLVGVDILDVSPPLTSADCKSSHEVSLLGASADCRNSLVISIDLEGCQYYSK